MSIETDIAALEEALNTGASEVYVDGQKVLCVWIWPPCASGSST